MVEVTDDEMKHMPRSFSGSDRTDGDGFLTQDEGPLRPRRAMPSASSADWRS